MNKTETYIEQRIVKLKEIISIFESQKASLKKILLDYMEAIKNTFPAFKNELVYQHNKDIDCMNEQIKRFQIEIEQLSKSKLVTV